MEIEFIRVEYMEERGSSGEIRYCFRFIKNMKYCDFILLDKEQC